MLKETCLYLVMAEIQVIQRHENVDQLRVIISMVLWSLALVTVFFKGLSSMIRYSIGDSKSLVKRTDLKTRTR